MKWLYSLAFLLALSFALPADAGMQLRQDSDGQASWVRTGNQSDNTYRVGRTILQTVIETVSTEGGTRFLAVPFSGQVTAVYVTLTDNVQSTDEEIVVRRNPWESAFTRVTVQKGGDAGGYQGASFSNTGLSQRVSAGDVLAIESAGASTQDVDATVIIVIDPY